MNSNNFKLHIQKNKKSLIAGFFAMLLIISGSTIYKLNNQIVHANDTEDSYVPFDAKPELILLSEIDKKPEDRDPNAVNSYSNPYVLSGVEDFYILQEFSKYNSCEGMYFSVDSELQTMPQERLLDSADYDGSKDDEEEDEEEEDEEDDEEDDDSSQDFEGVAYHIDLIRNCDPYNLEADLIEGTWYGIGMNFCYPFKGNIEFCGIKVRTDTSIFGFLGDGAVVKGLKVFGDITNEKNIQYYKQWDENITDAHIGGIASVAYIKDENGNNNSVTIANCTVADGTTIKDKSITYRGSLGGIIGACIGLNSKYGSSQSKAVNFNITGCTVNADISANGYYGELYNGGHWSKNTSGIETDADGNQVINKNNVKTTIITGYTGGVTGGLIGDVVSGYYVNVNIGTAVNPNLCEEEKNALFVNGKLSAMNCVYGTLTSTTSGTGGAIGHVYHKVFVNFSNTLSFYDNKDELKSITSKNVISHQQSYQGLLVGTAGYSLIVTSADFVLKKNDGTATSPSLLSQIPLTGNGMGVDVPANVYKNPNLSDKFEGTGGWTKTLDEDSKEEVVSEDGLTTTVTTQYAYTYNQNDAYKLSEPNDFVMLSIYLSTNGYFGAEFFDTTNKMNEKEVVNTTKNGNTTTKSSTLKDKETDMVYVRKATYLITRDVNISGTGINCINRGINSTSLNGVANGFSGKFIGKLDDDGNKPVLTFNSNSYQDYTGLFYSITPIAGTTVEFRDFDLVGDIKARCRASGFSYCVYYNAPTKGEKENKTFNLNDRYAGNLLFDNIDNKINISYNYHANDMKVSPYISYLNAASMYRDEANVAEEVVYKPTIDFIDSSYGGNVSAGRWYYGSLFGYIDQHTNKYGYNLEINIKNFLLGKETVQDVSEKSYIKHVANTTGTIGGLIGYINYNTRQSLYTFTESSYAYQNYYAEHAEINIENFQAKNIDMGVTTNVSHNLGGYIAHTFYHTNFNVKNATIENCTTSIAKGDYGGLFYNMLDGSLINLDGIHFKNFNIEQRNADYVTNIGGILGKRATNSCYNEGLVNISNYTIDENCNIIGTNRFSDFAAGNIYRNNTLNGDSTDHVISAVINYKNNEYSVKGNPYTNRFAYKETSTSTAKTDYKGYIVDSRLMYNILTADELEKEGAEAERVRYIITGTGTDTDPFIIDTPEKMMVMQMVSLMRFRSKADIVGDYFEFVNLEKYGSTTLCVQKRDYTAQICKGYYVFSDDIDLTNYSFSAITARGGSYYGFKADSYLTALSADTDEGRYIKRLELGVPASTDVSANSVTKAQVISHAIDILSRDQNIIETYEELYAEEYTKYVATRKATDNTYEFSKDDKHDITAILDAYITNYAPDDAGYTDGSNYTIVREYKLLNLYKSCKPTFTFDAAGIDAAGKAKGCNYLRISTRDDSDKNVDYGMYRQTRSLHSGLFTNLHNCVGARKVSINNIRLTGTFGGGDYTTLKLTNGGALISNGCLDYAMHSSEVDIRNISFGGEISSIHHTDDGTKGAGLLIDCIYSSTVDIYDIKIESGSTIGADALIGYQTGDASKVIFEHIDLNEAVNFNTDDSYNSTKFRKGLFYYNYAGGLSIYYYDDGDMAATKINTDIITPGIMDANNERRVENSEILGNIVYAYKKNMVEINPAQAHILLGDGTKDNPFVIDNVGQLTTLSQAFKSLGRLADSTNWFVGDTRTPVKTDEDGTYKEFDPNDTSTWEYYKNYVTWDVTKQTTDDTRKEKMDYLRTAYYVFVDDIDLYNVPSESDFKIASTDFVGLGIDTFPFSGSIDGSYKYKDVSNKKLGIEKRNSTEKNSTITLNNCRGIGVSEYGLIRYSDGVNISNLNIQSPKDTDTTDENDYIPITMQNAASTYYGMAIARVVGGDSVIDNVTAKGWVYAPSSSTFVGGLVGEVLCGTVTFTNIDKSAVKDFTALSAYEKKLKTDDDTTMEVTHTARKTTDNCVGGYVGRVYEVGICFYDVPDGTDAEGNSYKDNAIKNTYNDIKEISADLYENAVGYPAACTNRAYMINKCFIEGEKIVVTGKASTGYVASISNEKQLYILSLAIRCGALAGYYDKAATTPITNTVANTKYFPYAYYARTYKIYQDDNDDPTTSDDDIACYNSAIFEYFDFTSLKKESGKTLNLDGIGAIVNPSGRSMLNQYSIYTANNPNGTYRTTYTLTPNKVYDMTAPTVAGNNDTVITDFYGIGPKVGLDSNYAHSAFTFASDFNGNGSTVKYSRNDVAVRNNTRAGLFTILYSGGNNTTKNGKDSPFRIYDLTLSGSIEIGSSGVYGSWDNWINASAGALIGLCSSIDYIEVSDIKVENFTIKAKNSSYMIAGGLIGACGSPYLTIKDISIGGDDESFNVDSKNYSVLIDSNKQNTFIGGIGGYINYINAKNITVQNTCLYNNNSYETGGIIGKLELNNTISKNNYLDNIVVKNSRINNTVNTAGGIIGFLNKGNNTYSLSGQEIYLYDNEINVVNNDNYEAMLIGNHQGVAETGFVDVKWEYIDESISKPSKVWRNDSTKAEYFIINKLKDIESLEEKYGIVKGLSDSQTLALLESGEEISSGDYLEKEENGQIIPPYRRYIELIATDRIVNSSSIDRDYVFKYSAKDENGEIIKDENGETVKYPTDLVPQSLFINDKGEVIDDYYYENDNDNLLVEWDTSAGGITEVLNDILNTVTNGTGLINQGFKDENGNVVIKTHPDFTGNPNENIEVKVIPMQVEGGVASKRTEGNVVPSVSIVKNELTGFFDVTNTGQYDKIEKSGQPGTYSLIEISYNVSLNASANGTGYTKKIYIPFMVCNMIKTEIYTRIELGENYNAQELRKIEDTGLEITRDSSFTLYTEIVYSKNRQYFEENAVIEYKKMFVLNRDDAEIAIPVGTKLTLVDTTDGISKTYYYVVKENNKMNVKFTEFKDENGNPYDERNIRNVDDLNMHSKYAAMKNVNKKVVNKKKVGVEIFTIFVDISGVDKGTYTGQRSIWLPMVVDSGEYTETEYSTDEYFIKTDKIYTWLYTFDMRNIGFEKNQDYINQERVISKTQNLEINAKFYNRASAEYWKNLFDKGEGITEEENKVREELNDYANRDKYLEVCLSLLNSDGQKVLFPAGTKVKIGNNDKFEGIHSTSQIYYYKDSDGMFELDNKDRLNLIQIREEDGTLYTQHLEDLSIEFNFANAKLETLPAGQYSIELELLRTGNKDYPMGSEVLDTITIKNITVADNVEYGFSISDYDKADLSYNKKDESNPYSLDYSIKLESSYAPELTSDKVVRIEYELLKKDVQTGLFESIDQGNLSGNDTSNGQDGSDILVKIGDLADTGYKVIKGNEIIEEGDTQTGEPGVIDLTNISDTFGSGKQIITITDVPSKDDGTLTIPFNVTMPEDADAVNYKIVATLYSEGKDAREAEDMVIFNVSDIELY